MSTYAVSDLHGQFHTFEAGLEKIGFGESDRLYLIGDAIDRGADGIKILRSVKEHENMDLLIGNHELMMLNSLDPEGKDRCTGSDTDLWLYYNGGRVTFSQYSDLRLKERQALLEWLKERYVIKTLKIGETEFCLTHSYYQEGLENKRFSEMEMRDIWRIVWTSPYRADSKTHGIDIYADYDRTFITGHVPVLYIMREHMRRREFNELRIYQKGNFINIDGGCGLGCHPGLYNGALFLRLDDMEVFPIPIR